MSWLADSSELVSGWLSSAYPGHGILGADIPTTGDSGGSPVLNDSINSAKEYRWVVTSPPASGTLSIYEDCTFEYSNTTDGIYSFTYRLYEDGVDQGTATVSLQIGDSVVTISATTANAAGTITSQSVGTASCEIDATTGDVVVSMRSYSGTMTLTDADIAAIVAAIFAQAQVTPIKAECSGGVGNTGLTLEQFLALK